jgi:carbon monoxide dehydrogenase subunit G
VFVGDEMPLEVSFAAAQERLAQLTSNGALVSASEHAYSPEPAQIMRVDAGRLSKLVRVQIRELAWTDTSVGLAIRWEGTGPGGRLFPVLDADIRLIPAGEHGSVLMMAGSYRPPLGPLGEALDRAVLHRVATATIRRFLAHLAAQIGGGPGAAETAAPNGAGSSPPRDVGPS